jgi:N-acetylmuramoyl-L-alanine amidase
VTSKVLNAWPEVGLSSVGNPVSRICFESTSIPGGVTIGKPRQTAEGDYEITVVMEKANLVMAPDHILVADGLVRKFEVLQERPNSIHVTITLEHPVVPEKDESPGTPHLTRFVFPREPLRQVFQGRIIGIDPGHGGKDRGVKGPVNLLEKDVSMSIARELQDLLLGCGAVPVMTRTDDATIGHEERLRTLRNRSAELCVQVHVSGHRDPHWQKYRWFAKKGCGQSVSLGMNIGEALLERMGIRIEGPGALPDAIWDSTPFPVAQIEPLCLTHFVDEANFRAPLFRKRIGQAIYNGIHRWILASRRKAS